MSASRSYPRWLHPHMTLDGTKRLVNSAQEEETFTGVEMKEDGMPKYAVPPTREMIAERGYSPEAVEKIFAMERDKAAAREYPYGPNEPNLDTPKVAPVPPEQSAATPEVAATLDATTTNLDQLEPTVEVLAVDHEAVADALGLNG